MHVKKYTATNLREALSLVKKELGPDAVIISTKDIKSASGNGQPHSVEVTAAIDFNYENAPEIKDLIHPLQKEVAELKEIIKSVSPALLDYSTQDKEDSYKREAVELNSILKYLLSNTGALKNLGIHDSLTNLYSEAIDRGISERLAFRLIEKVNQQISSEAAISEDNIKTRFYNEMIKFVKTSRSGENGLGESKVVALVGPTGVGKTTTIAKLAADWSLNKKKDVALITIDTYRIAAIEQLKTYSKIIDLPISVARDKEEFNEALQLYKNKDLVLVDTAGRSRKDEKQMKELMDFLDGEIQVEIHLVLSSTDREDILFSNVKRFHPLSVDQLIFTKLDEANSFGMLFNIAMKTNKPISYFTTGQKVPEDIEEATAEKTIDLIFQLKEETASMS